MEGEGRSGSHEDRPLQAKVMDRKARSEGGEGSSPFWSEQGWGEQDSQANGLSVGTPGICTRVFGQCGLTSGP